MTRVRLPCGLRERWCSSVDLLPAVDALADAHLDLLAVRLLLPHADASRALAYGADDHHVPDGQRSWLLDDAVSRHTCTAHPAGVLDRPRLRVPLDDVQVLDDDLAVLRARVD